MTISIMRAHELEPGHQVRLTLAGDWFPISAVVKTDVRGWSEPSVQITVDDFGTIAPTACVLPASFQLLVHT